MANKEKLNEVKVKLTEAIYLLSEIKEYQNYFDMSRSIKAIFEFIVDDVPQATEHLERALNILESVELEED